MSTPAQRYAEAQRRAKRERSAQGLGQFEALYDFPLDDFQLDACAALGEGRSVLVAAPTGAGKTVVGEYAVYRALIEGTKCFYTTPIKAPSNQKYHDLVRTHGVDQVGLLTGDNSINGEAPVVVMTTEVLRNMLYSGSSTINQLGYVVMDEVHYLADRFRGGVWEEVIIQLPLSISVIALSATVSNAEEFGEWIRTVRGDTTVVVDEIRPVPLWQQVMVGSKLHDLFVDDDQTVINPHLVRLSREAENRGQDRPHHRRRHHDKNTPWRSEVVQTLDDAGLLPGITFIFSRAGCDAAVRQCLDAGITLTTSQQREHIRQTVEARTIDLPHEDLGVLGFNEWFDGLLRGVAAHHAGLIPRFKEIVEELFQQGLVRMVFATETLALGINMPARTVVLERLVKYNGEAHVDISAGEYTQLTGRAGRRGIDVEGHAVVAWHRELNPSLLAGLASTRTYPLRSSFRPSYTMAVGLVGRLGTQAARDLLETSFAQFQADRSVVGLAATIKREQETAEQYRHSMKCHLGDFSEYALLRSSLQAAERAASREVSAQKRHTIDESLKALRRGDIISITTGRRGGTAVVIDTQSDDTTARITVVTVDRRVRRLSVPDFTGPVTALDRLSVPKGFSTRSAHARQDLVKALRARSLPTRATPRTKVRRSADRESAITRLRGQLKQHPCHGCSDREVHARWGERYARLSRHIEDLETQIKDRTHSVARQFDRVCTVLLELGYLDQGAHAISVTESGQVLAGLYTEKDLLVSECLRLGTWADLDEAALAAVVSGMVFEARHRQDAPGVPGGILRATVEATNAIWSDLHAQERAAGVDFLKEPDWGLVATVHRWARGANLNSVLHESDLSAGDFVRWCKQVIDLLGQIADALSGHDPTMAERAHRAAAAIDRGVIRYSSAP